MADKLLYLHKTTQSHTIFEQALQEIPGGVQGNIKFYDPYPLSFRSASGAWLKDVDENDYVDYLLSFGALVLGHGHPVIKQAIVEAWDTFGTSSFGVPYPLELTMADKIKSLYPSIEQVRFTNSGLEATLLAIRLGMAYTGKPSIAKFAGHYHGGHEHVLVSTHGATPVGVPPEKTIESMGLPDYFVQQTEILPFNNAEMSETILRNNKDRIGVVVLEPLQSGYIPANPDFMRRLREVTEELGMVLVFDEVKTGFRTRLGGAQEFYGVKADLTALGKVLGGGFPVGAVGGQKDILDLCSPKRSMLAHEVVFHSGTFNGNPMSLLAGLRTIEFLQTDGNYAHLLQITDTLRKGFEEIGRSHGLPIKTIGAGSIFNLVFPRDQIEHQEGPFDVATIESSSHHRRLRGLLDFQLMKHGVFSKPYNRYSVSLAHDDKSIEHTLDAFDKSLFSVRELV